MVDIGLRHEPRALVAQPPAPRYDVALEPLIATFVAEFGVGWRASTRAKHACDFTRFLDWLHATDRPLTLASFDFLTLVAYVEDLRTRPKVHGVWRGSRDIRDRLIERGPTEFLSANSINAYMRPLRSLAIWLFDEGYLERNPFRRSRRRAGHDPLLPSEETPPKGASLDDLRALEWGCRGDRAIDQRDRAIVSILTTTAARNSSVRLLRVGDIDTERERIRFRRAKGDKTLEVTLHPDTGRAILAWLAFGRPVMTASPEPPSPDAFLFVSDADRRAARPLSVGAVSLMLTRRYRAGGGTLSYFGSHRVRHGTATLLVNHGMPLDEVSRYLGHSSTVPTRRYAQATPEALGERAADALARAGLTGRTGPRDEVDR